MDYHARYALKMNPNSDGSAQFVVWEEPNGKYSFLSNVRVYQLDDGAYRELLHVEVPVQSRYVEVQLHGDVLIVTDPRRARFYRTQSRFKGQFLDIEMPNRNVNCPVSFNPTLNEVRVKFLIVSIVEAELTFPASSVS
jgi:hypothetical protein